MFHIFTSLAEFERAIIRERARAGLDAARARGCTGGRPTALTARELTAAKAMLADPHPHGRRRGAPGGIMLRLYMDVHVKVAITAGLR